ncbi:MAG: tripartite tricarboxylate transporter TctB family protein [Clostridiales bacterium]|nr:tripartite tricarboxylate transporter TctB family protein [Clostridiales bacterium]
MKKISSHLILPIVLAIIGIIFFYIGVCQLGFWDNGPQSGFFPSIIAIILIITGIALFVQAWKNGEQPEYSKSELIVVAGGLSLIIGTFLIGMIPMIFLYVLFWLKVIEKTPWKQTLIVLAVVAVIVIGVFYEWLQVNFPLGLFELIL